jgi:hypothetical protein
MKGYIAVLLLVAGSNLATCHDLNLQDFLAVGSNLVALP